MVMHSLRVKYRMVDHMGNDLTMSPVYDAKEHIEGTQIPIPSIIGRPKIGTNPSSAILDIKKLKDRDFRIMRSTHNNPYVTVGDLTPANAAKINAMSNPCVHYVYIVAGRTREIHALILVDEK